MTDETKYHVKLSDGRQFGPANMAMLVKWAKEGRIPQDAMLEPDDGREPFAAIEEAAIAAHILATPLSLPESFPTKMKKGQPLSLTRILLRWLAITLAFVHVSLQ